MKSTLKLTFLLWTILFPVGCERSEPDESSAQNGRSSPPVVDPVNHPPLPNNRDSSEGMVAFRTAIETRDFGTVRRAVQTFATGEFETVWTLITSSDFNEGTKENLLLTAMLRATTLGEGDETQAKIVAEFGPGIKRSNFLRFVFSADPRPVSDLVTLMNDHQFKDEREKILAGLEQRIARSRSLSELGDPNKIAESAEGRKLLAVGIAKYLTRSSEGTHLAPARLEEGLALVRDVIKLGNAPESLMNQFLTEASKHMPFEILKIVQLEGIQSNEDTELQRDLVENMSRSDAFRTIETILETEFLSAEQLRIPIEYALREDISAGLTWYNDHKASLTPLQNDYFSAGFSTEGAQQNEFDTAWQWTKQITDPDIRKNAEGQVWQAERKLVQQEARQDPQQTVESLISEDAIHDTYWIETAMSEWITQDPNEAQVWYDSNAKSLSAEQNQHVAIAYARKALRDGNPDLAAQWADQVIEDELKTMIQNEIAAKP